MNAAASLDLDLLQSRLEVARARAGQTAGLSLAVHMGAENHFLCPADSVDSGFTEHSAVDVSCLAKSMTATLLLHAAALFGFTLDDEFNGLCDTLSPQARRVLAGISLRQLLNHSHGLDVSALSGVPRHRDERVDADAICAAAASGVVRPSGTLYSYSAAGYWLAACLVEELYGVSFTRALHERLLAPLGIVQESADSTGEPAICPAEGMGLRLSGKSLLSFLELHLDPALAETHGFRNLDLMRQEPVALPGWLPREAASLTGWKDYGDGWVGHNGMRHKECVLVRFHPDARVGLVLTSSDPQVGNKAFMSLFHDRLPEFSPARIRAPRLLRPTEWETLKMERYTGTYGNGRWRLETAPEPGQPLLLRAFDKRASKKGENPEILARLKPAQKDVFFGEVLRAPTRAHAHFIQFVQFVVPRNDGRFGYLWNGQELWQRAAS